MFSIDASSLEKSYSNLNAINKIEAQAKAKVKERITLEERLGD